MLERYCDILVIGNELPGLVTAAFLARRGLSVQVIDSDIFSEHPNMPDPVCLSNVQSKLLRSILGRLNVPELTIQNFLKQDSTLQIIFPKNRIDIFNNPLPYFEEIEREFPQAYPQIKAFYEGLAKLRHQIDVNELFQQVIPQTFKEKRIFKKFIATQDLNHKTEDYQNLVKIDPQLKAFFDVQYLLAYQQFCDSPFNFQVSELFNPGDGEIFSVYPGINRLKNMLLDRIRHYDGVVRKKIQINHLLFRNGIFEGADVDDNQGNILSKYIIWNDSLEKLDELLPSKWRFRKLRKLCQQSPYNYFWFTVRYSVDNEFIPEPLRSNVIVINNPQSELFGDNLLYLQIEQNKLESQSTVKVNFLLPKSALNEDADFFDPYFETIQKTVIHLLPFSEKSLKQEFPLKKPNQSQDTLFPINEDDFEIFKHCARLNGVTTQDDRSFNHLFHLNYRTPTPNLYLSHPQIFGSFGIESKLILGLKITDLIWHEVEKVKKRAMKSERRIA